MNNINNPDLNQLNVFRLLMETGHVSQVADKIGISQSAISHILKKLRSRFDDPLFLKTSTGMKATPRAQELYAGIITPLQSLNLALQAQLDFDPLTSRRSFMLGTSDYLEKLLLPSLIHYLNRHAPGIKIKCVSYRDSDLARTLQNVDLVFGRYTKPAENLYRKKLWQDSFVTLVNHKHPRIGSKISLEPIINEQHILISPSGSGVSIVDQALSALGHQREIILASHLFTTPLELVGSSELITTMPKRLALRSANDNIRLLAPPLDLPSFEVSMLWGALKHNDPAHKWLRSQISQLAVGLE